MNLVGVGAVRRLASALGPTTIVERHMRAVRTVSAILCFACLAPVRAADDTQPRYSLKQEQPDLGSNIKRDIVRGSVVPLDKDYAELTSDEKALVKSSYENLGPSDEPPYPIGGPKHIYKMVAAGQQKFLVTGTMTIAVEVDVKGEPASVSVIRSPDAEMTRFVALVLMSQKYKPAVCDGAPCVMQFPLRINFTTR